MINVWEGVQDFRMSCAYSSAPQKAPLTIVCISLSIETLCWWKCPKCNSEINRVCNKRKNSYKGYYFEFVNDKPIDEIKYKKGKQVEVFKEGVSLGIYESCNELSRKSLNDFGVEFLISEISNVCNGKRKSHKGYPFKYVK